MTAPSPAPAKLHGWLNIDKPLGMSSGQVVAACKRILRPVMPKGWKIGHGGTLDPLATGVLPIALGEATKLTGYILDATKGYDFTLRFGEARSTDDGEGEVIATSDMRPGEEAIRAALPRFLGEIEQVPPIYSALKVDGERAYNLARAGETVELKARRITIHRIDLVDMSADEARFSVLCSKGTYIRSLARDIAQALGTVGYVSALRRTKAGPFTLQTAILLDNLDRLVQDHQPEQALLPVTAGLDDIPALAVDPREALLLRQGQRLDGTSLRPGTYMAMDGQTPVAIVEAIAGQVRVLRGLNLT
ncbi:tRNA pseudouridine(55) synthase TruB [Pedomonas mirosovicensis]|uniref:tRNA pseudouridine(55) synthase TruB n=1 Tax=Pedomonas mirosovicensis TaxID=2908641 RepID=UPI00216956A2|nr:tRNA pseudouridine(55) synthase TruB [Pedomonas mirosovicensis]MCH8684010.1 tRNA pseudouridine(55) synthase TruB [Pedomonas mirosovicensis]